MFKNKLLTEIIDETGTIIKKKKFPVNQNTIQIKKAQRGRGNPAYNVSFNKDDIIYYFVGLGPFKRLGKKVMLKEGAKACISLNGPNVKVPTWDKETSEKVFQASVIKSAGATVQKIEVPILVYALLIFGLILGGLQLYLTSGRYGF